jgi:hypothetical protein
VKADVFNSEVGPSPVIDLIQVPALRSGIQRLRSG